MNRRVLGLMALAPLLLHAVASSGLHSAKRSKSAAVDGVVALSEEEEGARAGGKLLVGREAGRDSMARGQNLLAGSIFQGSVLATTPSPCPPGSEQVLDPVRLCCCVWSLRGLSMWSCVSMCSLVVAGCGSFELRQ